MKVLYLIDSHPENGGAPISTCNIAIEISKIFGSAALILPTQTKRTDLNKNIELIEIKGINGRFPLFLFKPFQTLRVTYSIGKIIKRVKPDIIHAQMPRGAWAVGFLKLIRLLPSSTICVFTDRDHIDSYRLIFKFVSWMLIKRVYDQIITLTEISASHWNKYSGKANVAVIPNSAGLIYENYNVAMHQKMRTSNDISQDKTILMFSGRMSIYKNWELAKKIILSLNNNDFFFVFAISTMNKEQEDRFAKFKKDIDNSGVKYLLFHNATQAEMSQYYYLADIFIMTSDKESFGRTAIEAMSRKCVVIGRNTGGLPEVIGKVENVLESKLEDFTNRIHYYNKNKDILEKHKEWYYSRFLNNYTVKVSTDRHQMIYENQIKSLRK